MAALFRMSADLIQRISDVAEGVSVADSELTNARVTSAVTHSSFKS